MVAAELRVACLVVSIESPAGLSTHGCDAGDEPPLPATADVERDVLGV